MLSSRIIPVLLVHNRGLVKTTNFKDPKYVGDPLNAVRIFNEKEADEIIIIDIDATTERNEPDFSLISNIASECRMPLSYGGGIKTIDQAKKILSLGVEKVTISSIIFEDINFVTELSKQVGRQSIAVVLDVKKKRFSKKYECYTHNAKKNTKQCPIELSQILEKKGAGEIIINSIGNDGLMNGYDLEIIHKVKSNLSIPVTAIGGAGSYEDIRKLINQEKIIGVGAGSLFVFKGKYRAVLINYPSLKEKFKITSLSASS